MRGRNITNACQFVSTDRVEPGFATRSQVKGGSGETCGWRVTADGACV
jgi:hypothetical protein